MSSGELPEFIPPQDVNDHNMEPNGIEPNLDPNNIEHHDQNGEEEDDFIMPDEDDLLNPNGRVAPLCRVAIHSRTGRVYPLEPLLHRGSFSHFAFDSNTKTHYPLRAKRRGNSFMEGILDTDNEFHNIVALPFDTLDTGIGIGYFVGLHHLQHYNRPFRVCLEPPREFRFQPTTLLPLPQCLQPLIYAGVNSQLVIARDEYSSYQIEVLPLDTEKISKNALSAILTALKVHQTRELPNLIWFEHVRQRPIHLISPNLLEDGVVPYHPSVHGSTPRLSIQVPDHLNEAQRNCVDPSARRLIVMDINTANVPQLSGVHLIHHNHSIKMILDERSVKESETFIERFVESQFFESGVEYSWKNGAFIMQLMLKPRDAHIIAILQLSPFIEIHNSLVACHLNEILIDDNGQDDDDDDDDSDDYDDDDDDDDDDEDDDNLHWEQFDGVTPSRNSPAVGGIFFSPLFPLPDTGRERSPTQGRQDQDTVRLNLVMELNRQYRLPPWEEPIRNEDRQIAAGKMMRSKGIRCHMCRADVKRGVTNNEKEKIINIVARWRYGVRNTLHANIRVWFSKKKLIPIRLSCANQSLTSSILTRALKEVRQLICLCTGPRCRSFDGAHQLSQSVLDVNTIVVAIGSGAGCLSSALDFANDVDSPNLASSEVERTCQSKDQGSLFATDTGLHRDAREIRNRLAEVERQEHALGEYDGNGIDSNRMDLGHGIQSRELDMSGGSAIQNQWIAIAQDVSVSTSAIVPAQQERWGDEVDGGDISTTAATPKNPSFEQFRSLDFQMRFENFFTTTPESQPNPLPELSWALSDEVWENLMRKESTFRRDTGMFNNHPELQPRMRSILLDWLSEVCEVYRLHKETFTLCVDFIDRYLSVTKDVAKTQLQLTGIAALFIAAKMEEIYPPKLSEFAYVTDSACSETDIIRQEMIILKALKWDLTPVTTNAWLGLYLQLANLDKISDAESGFVFPQFSSHAYIQVSRLCDLCLVDAGSLKYRYSLITAAALYHHTNDELVLHVSKFTWADLYPCVKWMAPFAKAILEVGQSPIKFFPHINPEDCHNIQTHNVDMALVDRAQVLQTSFLETERVNPEMLDLSAQLVCLLTPQTNNNSDSNNPVPGNNNIVEEHGS